MRRLRISMPNWFKPVKSNQPRAESDWIAITLGITLAVAVTGLLMAAVPYSTYENHSPARDGFVPPRDIGLVIDESMNSVVTVFCEFGKDSGVQGTGWAVSIPTKSKEYKSAIITNHHVIEDCLEKKADIKVQKNGRKEFPAKVIRFDVDNDLALLSTTVNIKALELSENIPYPGYWVVALGTADGYEGSVAIGNVLNLTQADEILITAAISHGNSGGPLIDNEGKVIGTNSWVSIEEQYNGAKSLDTMCAVIMKCEKKTFWNWD